TGVQTCALPICTVWTWVCRPSSPANRTARPRSKPCELVDDEPANGRSSRWIRPGTGTGVCAASTTMASRRPCHCSRSVVASPSLSTSAAAVTRSAASRCTTAGPTPSSRRYGLPIPITTIGDLLIADQPSGSGSAWRTRCTDVVADHPLALVRQPRVVEVEVPLSVATQVLLDARLVLRGRWHDTGATNRSRGIDRVPVEQHAPRSLGRAVTDAVGG